MPIVHVKLTEGATTEQKEERIQGITDLLVQVLDKNPASTHVLIGEVESDHWGIRGRTVAALRAGGDPGVSTR